MLGNTEIPNLRIFAETLTNMGIDGGIGLQLGEIPADFGQKFKSALAPLGEEKIALQ